MNIEFEMPWKRYAAVAELAKLHEKRGSPLGKTSLQKQVYLLQSLFSIDCGYEFSLYTYGPFSTQLLADLDFLQVMGVLRVTYDAGTKGYDIKPGNLIGSVQEDEKDFLSNSTVAFATVVDEFGEMYATDLELRATIVFSEREALQDGTHPSESELTDVVHRLKPHLSLTQIQEAVSQLRGKEYVTAF